MTEPAPLDTGGLREWSARANACASLVGPPGAVVEALDRLDQALDEIDRLRAQNARIAATICRVALSLDAAVNIAAAEAWDEGFDAGHQTARLVNPEYPDNPANPYRHEEEP